MKRQLFILLVVLPVLLLAGSAAAQGDSPPAANSYVGTLTVIVGDPMPVAGEAMTPVPPIFTLNLADGRELRLLPGAADENALLRLAGQRVSVTLPAAEAESALAADDPAALSVPVASAALAPGAAMVSPEVSGNTKWLSIACKFADVADEPKPLSYFQNMYANTYPGLDHYWREASYDQMNLTGSTAVGWYTLPNPRSYYLNGNSLKLSQLFDDCVAQVDPSVYFPDYYGINLMYNHTVGNNIPAYGGRVTKTLNGKTQSWAASWTPPWCYQDISCLTHEIGHGYGLQHVMAGTNPYGNRWDVMSDTWGNCSMLPEDPVYGCLPQHTIAQQRDTLGWIPAERKIEVGAGSTTLRLERTTQPGSSGYLMAILPINGAPDHFYTLETRRLVGYDRILPGNSVVIHEFGNGNSTLRDPYSDYSSYRDVKLWLPGQTWVASTGGILVHIDQATPTSFTVTVTSGLETKTVVMTAIADTYVDKELPDVNFGNDPTLKSSYAYPSSQSFQQVFFAFDRSQIPPLIAKARLHLTTNGPIWDPAPYSLSVRMVSERCAYLVPTIPIDEDSLTWGNHSECFRLPIVNWPFREDAVSLEYDIAGILTLYGQDAVNSLSLSQDWEGEYWTFSSREGPNPPQLIVEYLVPPDEPTTHTFAPTNDATVTQAKPNLVSGSKPTLQVRDAAKDLNAYVKFNVTGLEGAVQSATLRLWVTNGGPDAGRVYATSPFYRGTTTQWLETGLKWSNAPAISGAPLDDAGAVAAGQWIELDVTGAVTGNGRASFALTNDKTDLVVYSSKEGAHPPQLIVVTD